MYLLALRRPQEIYSLSYGGSNPASFCYDIKTGQVFNITPLCTNMASRTGSGSIVDVPGHEVWWPRETQFTCIQSCKSEGLDFGSAADSAEGGEVVIVDPLVLDYIDLLFE